MLVGETIYAKLSLSTQRTLDQNGTQQKNDGFVSALMMLITMQPGTLSVVVAGETS